MVAMRIHKMQFKSKKSNNNDIPLDRRTLGRVRHMGDDGETQDSSVFLLPYICVRSLLCGVLCVRGPAPIDVSLYLYTYMYGERER